MGVSHLKVNQEFKNFQEKLNKLPGSSKGGIYRLYLYKNGSPHTIQRLFSEDYKGVLYIGMTEGALLKRVCDLQKSLVSNSKLELECPTSSGHTQIGNKYYRIRKKINIEDLSIQIFPVENPKRAETKAIENYVQEFSELPPLNGSYGFFDPEWFIFS